jgi:hypothetical protein
VCVGGGCPAIPPASIGNSRSQSTVSCGAGYMHPTTRIRQMLAQPAIGWSCRHLHLHPCCCSALPSPSLPASCPPRPAPPPPPPLPSCLSVSPPLPTSCLVRPPPPTLTCTPLAASSSISSNSPGRCSTTPWPTMLVADLWGWVLKEGQKGGRGREQIISLQCCTAHAGTATTTHGAPPAKQSSLRQQLLERESQLRR